MEDVDDVFWRRLHCVQMFILLQVIPDVILERMGVNQKGVAWKGDEKEWQEENK